MASSQAAELVLAALEAGAAEQGLDIVSVEVGGPAGHPTLRVRVDTLQGGPIDMESVAAATPWVSQVVEEIDPFPGAYELEVSSPGLDRPLRRESDFARYVGERAEVRTSQPVADRSRGTGVITSAVDGVVTIDVDGTSWAVPFADIREARLKPDYTKIFAAAKDSGTLDGPVADDDGTADDEGED